MLSKFWREMFSRFTNAPPVEYLTFILPLDAVEKLIWYEVGISSDGQTHLPMRELFLCFSIFDAILFVREFKNSLSVAVLKLMLLAPIAKIIIIAIVTINSIKVNHFCIFCIKKLVKN